MIDINGILVPDSLQELLEDVGLSQYALYVQRGWHPKRGQVQIRGGTFQGSPLHPSCGYGCEFKTLPLLMLQY